MRISVVVVALVAVLSAFSVHAQGERIWRINAGLTGGDPMRSTDPGAIAAYRCSQFTHPNGGTYSYEAEKGVDANGRFWCEARDDDVYYLDWYDHISVQIFASVNNCPPGTSPSPVNGQCTDNPDPKKNTGEQCPCTGNPINPAIGNKFQTEADYAGRGPFPLFLKRVYNSTATAARSSGFGAQWSHSYERRLSTGLGGSLAAATSVIANRADGRGYLFVKSGTVFNADKDVPYTLSLAGGVWTLKDERDTVETYDSTGKLLTITRRDGQRQTLAYDASSRLVSVTDDYGHSLAFEYNPQQLIARITDPAGGVFEYSYRSPTNMLETVQHPDSTVRRYHYEVSGKPGLLTGITDENGVRFATYGYDAQGRAISTEHAGGANPISVVYNAGGASITDANGTTRQLDFASNHALVRNNAISGPSAATSAASAATTYDANGYVASRTDFGGSVTTFVHDARGLETSRTEAFGTTQARTISTQWHVTLRLPTRVTEPGRETTHSYDAAGNRLSMTVRDTATNATRTTSWTYNAVGQVLSMDGPRADVSDVTIFAYDLEGNLGSFTNALGQTTEFTDFDAHGNPTRMVDANGVVTTMAYDPRQRLLSRTVAGATTGFDYDANGQLTKVTQPDGAFLAYTYDAAQRLIAVEDNFGNRIAYTLDAAGNRIAEQALDSNGALARSRARSFDALNHLVRDEDGTGRGTAFAYDLEGKRSSTTDDLGRSTGFAYDALDRLTQATDAASGLTRYAYDARGNLVQVIDPKGVTTNYAFDGFDAVTATLSPDAGTTTYTYDSAGNRAQQTDARGIAASFEYDALNRLVAVRYPDSAEDVAYGYDESSFGVGRLTSITDSTGQTRYTYDAHGNVIEDARTIGTTTLTTHYAYDAADRLVSMTYPSGRTVTFSRDQAGRISDVRLAGLAGRDLATSLLHEPFGPVAGLIYGNGLALSRQFDLGGRLTAQQAGVVQQLGWAYDAAGNIIGLANGAHPDRAQSFDYDALDRLTQASGAYGEQQFQYDAVGNRLSLTDDGTTTAYGYDSISNRLLNAGSALYQYDANGNTTFDGTNSFAFNQANRLATVTRDGDQVAAYSYNALGQRVKKSAGTPAPDYSEEIAALEAEAAAHQASAAAAIAEATTLRDQAEAEEQIASDQRAAQDVFLAEAVAQYALEAEYRADTTAADLRAEAAGVHASALAAEAHAAAAASASIAATQAALALSAQAAVLDAQAEAATAQAAELTAQAQQLSQEAEAQAALASQAAAERDAFAAQAAQSSAQEQSLRAEAAEAQMDAAQANAAAAYWRGRMYAPPQNFVQQLLNAGYEIIARWYERRAADSSAEAAQALAQADAAQTAATTAQANATEAGSRAEAAALAAASLTAQASAATAQAATLTQQASTLAAQADTARTEAAAQEALAIEQREAEDAYLAQAQALYADEQQLLAEAEAADLTDEADAAQALALAADAAAAQAEQLSIAATEEALALSASADAQDALATSETALADAAQAQADYLESLQGQPGSFEETLFAYDLSGHLIGEYAADGTLKVEYAWLEDMLLAQLRDDGSMLGGTTVYWYQADHLNTPTQLTDASGQVVWDAVREPFGKTEAVNSTVSNSLRFPGQFEDAESGLHYNYFRDYDPATGRYVESDPIGLRGGLSTYLYANSAPTMYADAEGLTPLTVAIGIGVRVVGGRAAAGAIGVGARSLLGPRAGAIAACVLVGVCSIPDPGSDDGGTDAGSGSGTDSGSQNCPPDDDFCKKRKNHCIVFCQYELDFPERSGSDNTHAFRACVRRCMNSVGCNY